jgi:hypothetical protein
MFFEITPEDWKKAQGQIRGVNQRNSWERIPFEERYWTAPFVAAFVEKVDSLLLEDPHKAFRVSEALPKVAHRLRPEDLPGGERQRATLRVWAWAVRGSACRAAEQLIKADNAFQRAFKLAQNVAPWAMGEAWRRLAALHLMRNSSAIWQALDKAAKAYAGHDQGLADIQILRGLAFIELVDAPAEAAECCAQALRLIGQPGTRRARRSWAAAIQNLALALVRDETATPSQFKPAISQLQTARRALGQKAVYFRQLLNMAEGLIYLRRREFQRAFQRIRTAWKWFRRHDYATLAVITGLELAELHLLRGNPESSAEVIERTRVALSPKSPPELSQELFAWRALSNVQRDERRSARRFWLAGAAAGSPVRNGTNRKIARVAT